MDKEMKLKIEINTREHFNVLGLKKIPFKVKNTWFSGECHLISYELEELLATKLRALYQRKRVVIYSICLGHIQI